MSLRLETVKSETVELYKIKLGRVLLVYSLICWGSRQADSWRYRLLKLTPVLCVNRLRRDHYTQCYTPIYGMPYNAECTVTLRYFYALGYLLNRKPYIAE